MSTEKTSQDSKTNSLSKVAIKEPIVRDLEQDMASNEIKSGLLQFQNDEANDPSVIDQNDSRPSIDVGATNDMSEVRELNGDSNEQDSSVLFETEEEMCETLRRNWRTATAKQRLLVRNRQQEIENELNQLRDCIAKQGLLRSKMNLLLLSCVLKRASVTGCNYPFCTGNVASCICDH